MKKKNEEIVLSYTEVASIVWDYILSNFDVPVQYAPPIQVNMEECQMKDGGYVCMRHSTRYYVIDNLKICNPYEYKIIIYHNSYVKMVKECDGWNNHISVNMMNNLIMHDITHEYCHYILNCLRFKRMYGGSMEKKEKAFKDLVHFVDTEMGGMYDEILTETMCMQMFRKMVSAEVCILSRSGFAVDTLGPKPHGDYAKFMVTRGYSEFDQDLLALHYFELYYTRYYDNEKLSKAECNALSDQMFDIRRETSKIALTEKRSYRLEE